ncbi:MAG: hypothetical protein ACRD29_09420 [Acidimicrobiales bacterium]
MHPAVVADAGGLLVLAGLLEGVEHAVDEILALDATSLLVAEYLAVRHEGAPHRARVDFNLTTRIVREWFPVRAVAIEAAIDAVGHDGDIEPLASLALAESLDVPLVTKNRELGSRQIPVLHT